MNYNDILNHAWQSHLAPKSPHAPAVISTFAGCGGSSLGYSMAGFRELLAVEWDEHAVQTFKRNFPHVPVYRGDIAKLSVEQCLNMTSINAGELDVFDGSPPCFPSGTMILTNEGEQPIETIAIGTHVLTHSGKYEKIKSLHVREHLGELIMIEPRYGRDYITSTPEHPFFVKKSVRHKTESGSTKSFLEPQWLAAHELDAGDLLLEPHVQQEVELQASPVINKQRINRKGVSGTHACAYVLLERTCDIEHDRLGHVDAYGAWIPIRRVHRTVPVKCHVYNLEVENDHSYVANGFAVHNCQGFSTSGKRNFSDNRNQLFKEYVRLLRGLKPKVVLMENVSGMVKGKMKLIFAEILHELRACGYKVSVRLLNASHYGVPQARERLIFIGVRNDLGIAPSHPLGRFAPITVNQALQGCTPSEIVPLTGKNLAKMQLLRPGANAKEKERAARAVFGKANGFSLLRIKSHAPAPTILKTVSISPTFGAGLVMPHEDRYISIAELKRLGSFPDAFQLEGTFEERWARIGNSVPPLLMRAIAEHIKDEILSRVNHSNTAK